MLRNIQEEPVLRKSIENFESKNPNWGNLSPFIPCDNFRTGKGFHAILLASKFKPYHVSEKFLIATYRESFASRIQFCMIGIKFEHGQKNKMLYYFIIFYYEDKVERRTKQKHFVCETKM